MQATAVQVIVGAGFITDFVVDLGTHVNALVLARQGRAIGMSIDHKATRQSEKARIEAAGVRTLAN